jgi:hypothetical protein
MLGLLLAVALRWLWCWWERFSAPYGAGRIGMKGRAYW